MVDGGRRNLDGTPSDPDLPAGDQADALAAEEARERYRDEPMAPIEVRGSIADLLGPTERLLAVRNDARYDRRQEAEGSRGPGLSGDLYLTSSRLILLGRFDLTFDLEEIEEIDLFGDRLRLMTGKGAGLSLDVDQPRLLRVEIGAARMGARA